MNESNTETDVEEESAANEPETAENPAQDLSGTDGDIEGAEVSTDSVASDSSSSRMTVDAETEEEIRSEWVEYDSGKPSKMTIEELNVHYGDDHALKDIGMQIPKNSVTALIGPSGCGKSTYLRCLNRMNDRIKAARIDGDVYLEGENIYDSDADLVELRKRVGMVFQSPNPFPKTIRDNVSYGPRKHGDIQKGLLARLTGRDDTEAEEELVERSLKQAALWDEVHDRLDDNALGLSGGQQQRLCIARALATDPEVLLMDEPASALDPIATAKIEDLIDDLSDDYTVVIVTHNMQQAARVSDQTAVFLTGGELVEYGNTEQIFESPQSQRVEDYITGKFG